MTVLPRRDWRNERRQKILAAAADLFGASSYDTVQMRDVAARAEVGKPTLYRYFPSKEELFLEVFKSGLDRLDSEVAVVRKHRYKPELRIHQYVPSKGSVTGWIVTTMARPPLGGTPRLTLSVREAVGH